MRRAGLILRREVVAVVLQWRFLLNALLPMGMVLLGMVFAVPVAMLAVMNAETGEARLVLVDDADGLAPRVVTHLAAAGITVDEVVAHADAESTARLDAAVLDDVIDGWVHVDASTTHDGSWTWHGREPSSAEVDDALRTAIRFAVLEAAWAPDGDDDLAARLRDGGEERFVVVGGEDDADRGKGGVAMVVMALMFAIAGIPSAAMGQVEKEHQVGLFDLLVCTASPLELLVGKTVGAFVVTGCAAALWCLGPALLGLATVAANPELGSEIARWLQIFAVTPGGLAAWLLLLVTSSLAVTTPVVAGALHARNHQQATRFGQVVALVLPFGIASAGIVEHLDHPLVVPFSRIPVLGAGAMFARYADGAPFWEVLAVSSVTLALGVSAGGVVIRLGRGTRALGGWPRSLRDLRALWRA